MSIWGKIIGGAAGMMLGGPLGALLGVAGGHFWDKSRNVPTGVDERQVIFGVAVIALAAKMAKADGRVTKDEIRAFKKIFSFSAAEQDQVAQIYREAQKTSAGFQDYAEQAADILGRGATVLEELVWALAEIARADGHLHEKEMAFLQEVAGIFGLSPEAFARISALESATGASDPYAVLGVSRDASPDAMKAQYRKLAKELHPDRLMAQGLPEEAIELSGRKLAAINEAYDRLKSSHGIR